MMVILVGILACGTHAPPGGGEGAVLTRPDRVVRTEEAWRALLSPEEFHILREKGTERPFTGDYWNDHDPGIYRCAGCGLALFHSDAKFDSGTGWPSFDRPIAPDRVLLVPDHSHGMVRTEVLCARCGGHLGHVFPDGPPTTGERYCINGTALDKEPLPASR